MSRCDESRYAGVLIWADLDGTLLSPDRTLSSENMEAVRQLHAGGGRFGVATGRSDHSLSRNFPGLALSLPGVFYNGALMRWMPQGDILFSSHLAHEPRAQLKALMAVFPDIGVEVLQGGKAWLSRRSNALEAQLAREGLSAGDCPLEEIPAGWYKVLLGGAPETLPAVRAYLLAQIGEAFSLVYSESTLLEILRPGVSKGQTIRRYVDAALPMVSGRRRDGLLVTVGDNDNDADMLAMADVGIAMADGSEAALAAATHVIASNRTPCLPQVLALIDQLRERS